MPGYVQVIERIPKPGKNKTVLQRTVATLESLNRRGVVMESISNATERRVVGLLNVESMAALEKFYDNYRVNPDLIRAFEENGADCEKVRSDILEIVETPVHPDGEAKYWARNLLVARRGELPNLIAVMKEIRSIAQSVTPGITKTIGGNADSPRAVIPISSLEQFEAWNHEMASDKLKPYREQLNALTVQRITELTRVAYISRG